MVLEKLREETKAILSLQTNELLSPLGDIMQIKCGDYLCSSTSVSPLLTKHTATLYSSTSFAIIYDHVILFCPWNSLGQNTGVDSLSLLRGIFPTQGLNPGLPHCRQVLYQLSHKGSPRILDGQLIPSPADLPNPGIEPGSPALQVNSLPTELSGKPLILPSGV